MEEILINKHMNLLGLEVQDKVTGMKGIVSSISFDLYGCIQATITPKVTKNNEKGVNYWYDISRLNILKKKPVMERPNFKIGRQAEGKQGCDMKQAI